MRITRSKLGRRRGRSSPSLEGMPGGSATSLPPRTVGRKRPTRRGEGGLNSPGSESGMGRGPRYCIPYQYDKPTTRRGDAATSHTRDCPEQTVCEGRPTRSENSTGAPLASAVEVFATGRRGCPRIYGSGAWASGFAGVRGVCFSGPHRHPFPDGC